MAGPQEEETANQHTEGVPPIENEGQQNVITNVSETVVPKRGPGRQTGWRKIKPTIEDVVSPVTESNSIVGDVKELDRLLTERLAYAEPNLADPSATSQQKPIVNNADPRYKIPDFIEEPYAGPPIKRAHTSAQPQAEPTATNINPAASPQSVVPEQKFEKPLTPANPTASTEAKPDAPKKPTNPTFAAKSPSERKKEVKDTADMYLKGYQQVFPMPFKWISKFNIGKLDKLHMQGAINLNMLIAPPTPDKPAGVSLKDYVNNHNGKVEEIFVIPDQWLEDLRPHLEDVLMEKEIAHTPMERLIGALIPQVLTFAKVAAEQFQTQRMATKEMHNMAAELKRQNDLMEAAIRAGTYIPQNQQNVQQPVQHQAPSPSPATQQNVNQPISTPETTNVATHTENTSQPVQPASQQNTNQAQPSSTETLAANKTSNAIKVEDYLQDAKDEKK